MEPRVVPRPNGGGEDGIGLRLDFRPEAAIRLSYVTGAVFLEDTLLERGEGVSPTSSMLRRGEAATGGLCARPPACGLPGRYGFGAEDLPSRRAITSLLSSSSADSRDMITVVVRLGACRMGETVSEP